MPVYHKHIDTILLCVIIKLLKKSNLYTCNYHLCTYIASFFFFITTTTAGNFSIPPFNTTCKDRTNTTLHCKPKSFHALEWHVYNLDFIHCKSGGVTNSNGSTLTLMCGAYEVRCLYQVNETSYRSEVVYVSKGNSAKNTHNVV